MFVRKVLLLFSGYTKPEQVSPYTEQDTVCKAGDKVSDWPKKQKVMPHTIKSGVAPGPTCCSVHLVLSAIFPEGKAAES